MDSFYLSSYNSESGNRYALMLLLCQGMVDVWRLYGGGVCPGRLGVGENYSETQSKKVASKYNSNMSLIVSKQLWKTVCKLFVWCAMLGFTWRKTISEVLSLWSF